MKHYKYLFFILALLNSISCKKGFLDVPDKTKLIRQAYVTDLKTTADYLNGVYVNLAAYFFNGNGIIYPEIIADNIKPVTGLQGFIPHYGWNQRADDDRSSSLNSSSANVNGLWYAGYRIIRDCSFIIESTDKYRAESIAKADDIKGQAYAIRALVHFVLASTFAQPYNFTPSASHPGIPYITTSDISQPVSRQSVNEVYNSLITDLNNAIKLLPANSPNILVFNGNAAKALLARIYLFKEDYQGAKNLAREVSITVPIMMTPNYPSKLFTRDETEALFQLPPAWEGVVGGGGAYNTFFAGFWFASPVLYYTATTDIASILKENIQDVRNSWVSQDGSNWLITKYPKDVILGFPFPTLSYYQTLMRSSEIYLIAAESYAQLNNTDSARYYLDAIRKRADSSALASTASGAPLLDSICKERRKELVFEGVRMYDLLRWKKAVNRMDALNPPEKSLPYPSNKAIAPIPRQDVSLSGLSQNIGY